MRRAIGLLPILMLAACEQPYHAPILYQARTPGCQDWADGSRFELPRNISVFAGAPEPGPDGAVQLRIAYFVPRGESVEFSSQAFAVSEPESSMRVPAVVASVDRGVVNAPGTKTELLPSLPNSVVSLDIGDETMVRVTLIVPAPPKRFDLLHPRMLVGGKTYPVRTYTYRWFAERNQFGLCT